MLVTFKAETDSAIASPKPIFDYLKARGGAVQGEYIVISGWPVQFLPPTGPLVEEALRDAVTRDVEGTPARVFTAEHLAAVALQTARATTTSLKSGEGTRKKSPCAGCRHRAAVSPGWRRFGRLKKARCGSPIAGTRSKRRAAGDSVRFERYH
jgi:hypothetical protein